jgi:hypothetical protein
MLALFLIKKYNNMFYVTYKNGTKTEFFNNPLTYVGNLKLHLADVQYVYDSENSEYIFMSEEEQKLQYARNLIGVLITTKTVENLDTVYAAMIENPENKEHLSELLFYYTHKKNQLEARCLAH